MNQLVGDEQINATCTAAMHATLNALVRDGLLAKIAAEEFADKHVCVVASAKFYSRMLKKLFGNDNHVALIVRGIG